MKYLIIFCGLSTCFCGCTSNEEQVNSENVELINRYIAAVEKMDFEGMGNYLAEDYMGMGPSYGDTIRKKEAIENWKSNVSNLYEKIHYNRSKSVGVYIPDGDNKGRWVANWAELNIVYKHNKGSVTIWANSNYMVENGKIVRSLTFYNEADALRQLGYRFVAPIETE